MPSGYDEAPFRVMAPFEQARFTPEAWGLLLRLRAAGTLTGTEFEQVIERALLQVDGRIGANELRALLGGGAAADSALVRYYLLYPNLMLGIHPDYLVTHRVWPRDAADVRNFERRC